MAGVGVAACGAPAQPPGRIDWPESSLYAYREGKDCYVLVGKWKRRIMPKHTDVAAKIADMDRTGIAMAGISSNDPGPELFGRDSATMAVLLNDFISDSEVSLAGTQAWQ